jgi:hypothetical protein
VLAARTTITITAPMRRRLWIDGISAVSSALMLLSLSLALFIAVATVVVSKSLVTSTVLLAKG